MFCRALTKTLSTACLCSLAHMGSSAQTKGATNDASWAKAYATDCGSAMKHPCPPSTNGYQNEFNGDPRLLPLLKASLPQGEAWWVNGHAGAVPVSSIVQEFLGVPGALLLNGDRYVTATGCVPHFCPAHGLLWIDTGTRPATVLFVGEGQIGDLTSTTVHLWIYGSQALHFEDLPQDFLANLDRWHKANTNPKYDPQVITLATVVQPNGRMQDLTYNMLFYKQNAPQFHPSGASK